MSIQRQPFQYILVLIPLLLMPGCQSEPPVDTSDLMSTKESAEEVAPIITSTYMPEPTASATPVVYKVGIDVFDDEGGNSWNLVYDIDTGTLVKYSQDDQAGKEGENNAVWYALAVGTIASIALLFIIYLVVRKKQR